MLHLKIITPQKIILQEDVESVTLPSFSGEITILPHHTNLFSLLVEGIIKIKRSKSTNVASDKEDYLAIGGGYVETDGEELNILVSKAYGQSEIDEQMINKAIENAEKILKVSKDQKERTEASSLLRRSLIDIKLIKKHKAPRSYSGNI